MTRLFKNNVTSELAVGIDAAATEIQILDPSSFPATIPGSQIFLVTLEQRTTTFNEICRVTNIVGDKLTIVRGQEGTTPLAFQAFDIVESRLTAAALDEFLIDAPVDGAQYLRQAGSWQAVKGGAGITADPPANPMPGQLWWESDSGALNIWYIDANTSQWVQTNANGLPDASADGNTYARKNNAWVVSVTAQDITTGLSAKVAKAGDQMTGGLQVGVSVPSIYPQVLTAHLSTVATMQWNSAFDASGTYKRVATGPAAMLNIDAATGNLNLYTAISGAANSVPNWVGHAVFYANGSLGVPGTITSAGATINGPLNSGNFSSSGNVSANGTVTVGNGQVSSLINMADTDNGMRYIHNNGGYIGFLTNAGGWGLRTDDSGTIWCAQMGDVYTWIEQRAAAHSSSAVNGVDYVYRVQMAGYGESYAMGYATDGPNVVTDCFFGGYSTQRKWRTLQMHLPRQGGWYNIWVS